MVHLIHTNLYYIFLRKYVKLKSEKFHWYYANRIVYSQLKLSANFSNSSRSFKYNFWKNSARFLKKKIDLLYHDDLIRYSMQTLGQGRNREFRICSIYLYYIQLTINDDNLNEFNTTVF